MGSMLSRIGASRGSKSSPWGLSCLAYPTQDPVCMAEDTLCWNGAPQPFFFTGKCFLGNDTKKWKVPDIREATRGLVGQQNICTRVGTQPEHRGSVAFRLNDFKCYGLADGIASITILLSSLVVSHPTTHLDWPYFAPETTKHKQEGTDFQARGTS